MKPKDKKHYDKVEHSLTFIICFPHEEDGRKEAYDLIKSIFKKLKHFDNGKVDMDGKLFPETWKLCRNHMK